MVQASLYSGQGFHYETARNGGFVPDELGVGGLF